MFLSHIFSRHILLHNVYKMLMHINLNDKIIFSTDRLHTCKVNRPGQTCVPRNVQREKCISAARLACAHVKISTKNCIMQMV